MEWLPLKLAVPIVERAGSIYSEEVLLETVLSPSITELDSKPYHDSVDASKSKLGHPRLLQHPHDQTDFNCSWIGGNNWPPMRAVVFRDSTLYVTTRRAYVDITSRLER